MENRKSSAPRLLVAIVDRDKGNIIADLCSGQKLELKALEEAGAWPYAIRDAALPLPCPLWE